ncbi:glycine cleavage system protein GcvH [Paenibacillus sambharensis]|uniref:Glycine cleavage system H protein n=1 Tax=Paenibacillus sambharensis TaxID=1803190 RepID=A0A2W1LRY1_9BACL|nr:glycine cleavage system protein GcvH [Paenibacillus sambharensis]PZD97535.1 glycine cleavage system protein GcvH [Paenibacillus sambharensis]
MSVVKDNCVYSHEHEWAAGAEGQTVRIGISDHAQSQLGDIVFVELPQLGAKVDAGDSIGSIESVKTVSELYSPVSGTVKRVNETLLEQPELINEQPYEGGWIAEVEVEGQVDEALAALLTAEKYRELVE